MFKIKELKLIVATIISISIIINPLTAFASNNAISNDELIQEYINGIYNDTTLVYNKNGEDITIEFIQSNQDLYNSSQYREIYKTLDNNDYSLIIPHRDILLDNLSRAIYDVGNGYTWVEPNGWSSTQVYVYAQAVGFSGIIKEYMPHCATRIDYAGPAV